MRRFVIIVNFIVIHGTIDGARVLQYVSAIVWVVALQI